MEDNDTLTHDTRTISTVFKNFFSRQVESLLIKLPNLPDKYNLESVINYYYSSFTIAYDFCLIKTSENKVLKIISKIEISNAVIDRLSGRFLRDTVEILSRPIEEICNLSIYRGVFLDACKVAKLKAISDFNWTRTQNHLVFKRTFRPV